MRHTVSFLLVPLLFVSFLVVPSFSADEKVTQIGFEAYRRLADSRYWELVDDKEAEEAYSQLATGFLFLLLPSFSTDEHVTQKGIEVLKGLADFYRDLKDYRAAKEVYSYLAELSLTEEEKGNCIYNISFCFYNQKKYRQAIEESDRLLATYPKGMPDYEIAYYMKGYCYLNLGEYDEAIQCFRKLIEEEPGSRFIDPSEYHLARILYFQGKYKEALAAFKQLSKKPLSSAVIPDIAKQIEENIEFLEKLIEKSER